MKIITKSLNFIKKYTYKLEPTRSIIFFYNFYLNPFHHTVIFTFSNTSNIDYFKLLN